MSTKKKTTVRKVAKTSAKKNVAKKSAKKVEKKAAKKSATKKPASAKSASSSEEKLTKAALKMVDQAAELLRQGILAGEKATDSTRHVARKKAHVLLNDASGKLEELLAGGTATLRKVIGRI